MLMESPPGSARSSPEAELGHRVEDLWDVMEPQLSPSEKLNSCFESILVSSFPPAPPTQVIEIPSDATLAEVVRTLSENGISSAPVWNVEAPADASWIDRYIGIVEFAGIAVWLLHQSEAASGTGTPTSPTKAKDAKELAAQLGTVVTLEAHESNGSVNGAAGKAAGQMPSSESATESVAAMGGTFFEALTSSEFYRNTKVRDISGSFRWAPFLALQSTDSFLTMLLLLSKYKMNNLPVVDLGEGKIDNIITLSAVVHMLAECAGLHWFEDWGMKTISELGLPYTKRLVKISEEEPVLRAFQLMRKRGISGLPVVDKSGKKALGTISISDVQYLLTHPEIYKDYRSITAKDFIMALEGHAKDEQRDAAAFRRVVTCARDETIKDVILRMDREEIYRIYIVDGSGDSTGAGGSLRGVITLRDVISRLVHEPHGYFGDFFDGVVPLPQHSRV